MVIGIWSELKYFDEDRAKVLYENHKYSQKSILTKKEWQVFKEIFVDKTLKITLFAKYNIDFDECWISPERIESDEKEILHPVSRYYSMGNYKRLICDALESGKIISAMELLEALTGSMNIHDVVWLRYFMDQVIDKKKI